ncbi:hypothetical protein FRACA_2390004 [Frankia canadensis]|uniref:Uncharacterized protein n=1 Tax=Frankia canadensis TaxID=1836972 RepID=A0A2I2KRM7_9ACTN|nr:hypothetical protein FRACA_2390004 [Frankia canadensis]SOU55613.1 hypothetical protein FRACA_2390004 [Frankia canadensis]
MEGRLPAGGREPGRMSGAGAREVILDGGA